jgi:hypothetical protein
VSSPRSVFKAAIDAAEAGPTPYLIYGGLAAGIWGEPRYTEDVDLVLFVPERQAFRFLRTAAKFGFAVEEDLHLQQLQVSGWARLPLGDAKSPWHLDLTLGDSPFDKSALERRREFTLFDRKVWIASPEDLLVYKLVSNRDRDAFDIQAILRRQKSLDLAYVRRWAAWWEKEGITGLRQRLESLLSASKAP